MRLATSRFGEVNYTTNEVITVKEGITGLENYTRYLILRPPESKPFLWLQSLDDPSIALPVIPVNLLIPDYKLDLTAELKAELQLTENERPEVYCLVYLEKKLPETTVNLLTPILVNPTKKLARQLILEKKPYTSRHSLLELLAKAKSSRPNP